MIAFPTLQKTKLDRSGCGTYRLLHFLSLLLIVIGRNGNASSILAKGLGIAINSCNILLSVSHHLLLLAILHLRVVHFLFGSVNPSRIVNGRVLPVVLGLEGGIVIVDSTFRR